MSIEARHVFALIAAAIHVLFFAFESLFWTRPAVRARFRQTEEQAETTKLLAFNQGFYNLFLALGVLAGLILSVAGRREAGEALVAGSCIAMLGAAVVLVCSSPRLFRGAILQGAPPAIYLAWSTVSHFS